MTMPLAPITPNRRLLSVLVVGLVLAAFAALLRGADAPAAEANCGDPSAGRDLNRLIEERRRSGRTVLELDEGRFDNSCATLVVPADFRVTGQGDGTLVILPRHPGDLASVGVRAMVSYVKLQVNGAPNDVTPGQDPCRGCFGVRLASKAEIDHVRLQGTTLGFMLDGDHIRIRDSVATKNYFGVFQDFGRPRGNAEITGNDLTGNAQASIGITPWAQMDSAYLRNNHMGFSPYCMFAEGSRATTEFAVTNIDSSSDSCESPGAKGFYFADRRTSGVWVMPRTGPVGAESRDATKTIWESGGPAPSRVPGERVQTLILGAGGDEHNGPLLNGAIVIHRD
jgi:hypothetical protein